MDPLLHLHRRETVEVEPEALLGAFPQAFIQYIDDTPARDPRKALSTPLFHLPQAASKQRDGCGVYFAPNAFVGARRQECLQRIQAIFLDIDAAKEGDGQSVEVIEQRKVASLIGLLGSPRPPHLITETKHGLQPLWRVMPLAVPEGLRLFRVAIEGLLHRFGGDLAARDPVRVLRLPGFLHLKNPSEPFPCRLLWNDLEREPTDLRSIIEGFGVPATPHRPVPLPPRSHDPFAPDIGEVVCAAAREAGITVTLRRNRNGSRQIIEDGEVTSGFVSGRGNFCYSASGKGRKGGPLQLVQYYLNLDREAARRWLTERFGLRNGMPSARHRAPKRGKAHLSGPRSAHPSAPITPKNSPDCLARDAARGMDVPPPFPLDL
jgi:hypothetical protein